MKVKATGEFLLISQTGWRIQFNAIKDDWKVEVIWELGVTEFSETVVRTMPVGRARKLWSELVEGCGYQRRK